MGSGHQLRTLALLVHTGAGGAHLVPTRSAPLSHCTPSAHPVLVLASAGSCLTTQPTQQKRGEKGRAGRREEPKVGSSILNDLGLLLKGWQMTSLLTPLPGSLPFLRTDSTILALNNFQILPHTLRENLNDYGN